MIIIAYLLFTLIFSYISIRVIIKYAHKLDLYDVPNERSHHCRITPSGAGIGFITIFIFSLLAFYFQFFIQYPFLLLSIFIVFSMGIYDDMHDVSAKKKFIAIFIAVFVISFDDIIINSLGSWYGYELTLPFYAALLFTMFAVAGFTNALNLIDGIDGLAGSVSIVILLFFVFIGLEYDDILIFTLSSFSIAAVIGFLFLNWSPAKIFMGDSGSLTLGFIISILAVLSIEYIHPITILYLTAIPLLDTLIVMVRRIRRGKNPFRPDKTHLHHILVKFFEGDVPKTVYFLTIMQIVFSAIGYALLDSMDKGNGNNIPLFALIGFGLMFVLFYMIFTGIKRRQAMLDKNERL